MEAVNSPSRKWSPQAMAKLSAETLAEIDAAFDRYESEVRAAGLRPSAEKTYLLHSSEFVRWLHDDFTPGARQRH